MLTYKEKKIYLEIIEALKNSPSTELFSLCTTEDLVQQWFKYRNYNEFYSRLLAANFGSGAGNPAKDALKNGRITTIDYELLLAFVAMDSALFTVFQVGWTDIKKGFAVLETSPDNELKLFSLYLKSRADERFNKCVQGYQISKNNIRKAANLFDAKNRMFQKTTLLVEPEYSSDESDFFNNLQTDKLDIWCVLGYSLAIEAAKTDISIKRAIRHHLNCAATVGRLLANTDVLGIQWKDGIKSNYGDRGKLKACT